MRYLVHFSRGLLLAGGLLAVMRAGAAEDTPKKPADDSITANRKELESLRMDPALNPATDKLGLPAGLDMPGLTAGPAAPTPTANPNLKEGATMPAKPSSGWLIDGMEKARNDRERDAGKNSMGSEADPRDRKDLENFRTSPSPTVRLNAMDAGSKSGANDRESLRELKPGEKVPNPLAGYMATWMSAGDYSLLQKPAAINGSAFLTTLPDFSNPTSAGLAAKTSTAIAGGGPGETAGFAPGSPAAPPNPYLEALSGNASPANGAVPELSSRSLLAPVPVTPPAPPAWLVSPAPEPSRASPLVPENLKPSDDAKYFPQLKRF